LKNACAFGDWFGVVFGEADPPLENAGVERVVFNALVNKCGFAA
jgi:hypothetical protein